MPLDIMRSLLILFHEHIWQQLIGHIFIVDIKVSG